MFPYWQLISISDYEAAITDIEVINPNATPTRDQAIKIMKDTKDLLDLGVITQEKYDSIKTKMSQIIMK